MRIGLFTDTYLPDINGVVSSVETLRKALEVLGNEVFVVCPSCESGKDVLDDHILYLAGFKAKFLYGYTITSPRHKKVMEDIKNMNLDVIHVHTEFGVGLFARKVAKDLNIPIVATYHTFYEDYTHYVNALNLKAVDYIAKKGVRFLSKYYGQSVDRLIVPTNKTKERLVEYGIRTEMDVIPTGLDLSSFYENDADIIRPFNDDKFMLLFVGRLAEEKAVDEILSSLYTMKQSDNNVALLIVGDGPDKKKLEQLTEKLGLTDIVKFQGRVEHKDIVPYYREADAFISASMSETQGMTFIEALATGTVILARDTVALADVLIDGENGYFFKSSGDLIDKINLLRNKTEQEKETMRKECLKMADNYSLESFGKKAMETYQKVIDADKGVVTYFVDKLKLTDDYAKLTVIQKDKPVETNFVILLNDYFDLGIRKDQQLTQQEYDHLTNLHGYCFAYQKCLRKITQKDQSVHEIKQLLAQQENIEDTQRQEILDDLISRGYLNDEALIKSQIEYDQIKLYGRKKTKYNLIERGLDKELVQSYIDAIDDDFEIKRGVEKANQLLKTIRNRSHKETISQLKQKLIGFGYSSSITDQVVSRLNLEVDLESEQESLQLNYQKALRKYEGKFKGNKLRQKVYQYLYTKGFSNSDILECLNELEVN